MVTKQDTYRQFRAQFKTAVLTAVASDRRVSGCIDYGSTGQGAGDGWSDLDLALFIEDDELTAFENEWQDWAAQFGRLLLAYKSFVGHPWAIYDSGGYPLRVDFSFRPASFIDELIELPLSPDSAQSMVLYDDTDGRLTAVVEKLVGKSLAPVDPQSVFGQACGDFWYLLLRCHVRLLREQYWAARNDYHSIVLPRLMALLRLESGSTERWLASNSADNLEIGISAERLAALRACVPDTGDGDLLRSLAAAANLAAAVCASVKLAHGWSWSEELAERVQSLLEPHSTANVALPKLTLKPIGVVENSIERLLPPDKIKSQPSRIRIHSDYSQGLEGLNGGQRLLVVFHFDRLEGCDLLQHPHNNPRLPVQGVFALHSPRRPNPIGVTEVDLLKREGNLLFVEGLDAVNGTPVLDLKLNKR